MEGFSKLSKEDKINWLIANLPDPEESRSLLLSFMHQDKKIQAALDQISENSISNFSLPFGILPELMVNGKNYILPMVTEESSVIAAASAAAKFWNSRGGFHSKVISNIKTGQIHFIWKGNAVKLKNKFSEFIIPLRDSVNSLSKNMEERGGGILKIELAEMNSEIPDYYQLKVSFGTADSMGANFINSCLERMADELKTLINKTDDFSGTEKDVEIIMSILSNYNPDCLVESWIEGSIDDMQQPAMSGKDFVSKLALAVRIAEIDINRAVTHNKGIFNGIDAVVLATGNDFRAVEAGGHAWAARNGKYTSLSRIDVSANSFRLSLTLPLSLGTVGGLTGIHPLSHLSLILMGKPGAELLMQLVAAAGLANHFSALRSLVTTGIQHGHMKMHLVNILASLNTNESEKSTVLEHFREKTVSYSEVRIFLETIRKKS